MIRVSLNELVVRTSRALQGIGLPAGIADDAAAVAAWHDLAGLDGIGHVCAALPTLRSAAARGPPDITVENGARRMDAAGGSLLTLAGTMVDCLECASSPAETFLVVTNGRDLGLIGGVAALAADRGLAATFRADTQHARYHAVSDGAAVWWASAPHAAPAVDGHEQVQAWAGGELSPWPPADAAHVLAPGRLAEHRQTALAHGVPVDAHAWAEIYALAKRILVDDSGA